ncbi:MAG TPA: hypothetical protein VNS63_27545 [Blastocatellia bacterium]|nr:hypothetical protein [Blastocatellia bacterium]
MTRTILVLLLSALTLLGAGWFLYHVGSQQNLELSQKEETLWDESPGDKWLYVGGLMMLVSGALAAAAARVWVGSRRVDVISAINGAPNR